MNGYRSAWPASIRAANLIELRAVLEAVKTALRRLRPVAEIEYLGRMLTMPAAIALRTDFTGSALRHLARYTRDANQARRPLALAVIYDGGSRSAAAHVGGVGLQITRG